MTESSLFSITWDAILSRNIVKIRKAFEALPAEDQAVVLEHLHKMATEPGWHPEQVISACEALKALEKEI